MCFTFQIFIKNLLSAIFSKRSTYETYNHHFKYSMGCDAENPYLLQRKPVEVPTVRYVYNILLPYTGNVAPVGAWSFNPNCI